MALLCFFSVFQLHSLKPGPNGKAIYAWPRLQSGESFVGYPWCVTKFLSSAQDYISWLTLDLPAPTAERKGFRGIFVVLLQHLP